MTIGFIHPHRSFLPELDAYRRFFERYNIESRSISPPQRAKTQVDLEWHFMGWQSKWSMGSLPTIHEYSSASVPPFARFKDWIKRHGVLRPSFRLFQSPYVRDRLHFSDSVPFGYRDMGVHLPGTSASASPKEYDFIYAGSVSASREMDRLLDRFEEGSLADKKVLILSSHYERLQKRHRGNSSMEFRGPVPPAAVGDFLQKARFGLNFVPDKEPFSHQTTTKILEYAAHGLPIVTNDYPWIRKFQSQQGGKFFFLKRDFSNFRWENLTDFNYESPDLQQWSWERQIRQCGVLSFIETQFPMLRFDSSSEPFGGDRRTPK